MLGKTTREIVFHFVKRVHILFSPTKKALKEAIQEINFRNADHFIAKRCGVNAGVKFFTQYSTEIMRRKTCCWWLIWLGGKSNKSVIYSTWGPKHTKACFEKRIKTKVLLIHDPIQKYRLRTIFTNILFLATLVALHFIPVSKSVGGRSFGLQPSSVAWSLRACFSVILLMLF